MVDMWHTYCYFIYVAHIPHQQKEGDKDGNNSSPHPTDAARAGNQHIDNRIQKEGDRMIDIDERYYIETDSLNWILCKKGVARQNAILGYYSKLPNLLKDLVAIWAREKFEHTDASLQEAISQMIQKQKEYETKIDAGLKGY